MIYLNGQIGAVYMNGHYHSEAYLGSVLVWQNVKKIPGDAHAQLAFENTADGVAVVLLPGNVVGTLSLIPVADGVATQTTAPEVHSNVRTEANIKGSTNAGASANIFGNINVKGTPHAEVHSMGIGDASQGITFYTKPDGDSLTAEIGTGEQDIVLHTPKPPGDVIDVKDIETGIDMKMHTPRPPAVAGIVKPTETGIDMQLLCPSVPALGIVVEKIKAHQKIHMAESAEGAGIALGDSNSGQLLDLLTPHPPADAVFYKDDVFRQSLGMHTPKPPGDDVFVKNGEPIELDVALTTPSVPAEGLIVEKGHLTIGLQIDTDYPPGGVVNAANAASTAKINVSAAPTAHGDPIVVEGATEAQTKMSASAAPGDAAGISATGQSGLNVSAEGIGSTATPTEAQGNGLIKTDAQAKSEAAVFAATTLSEKVNFVSRALGEGVGWLDPEQSVHLLYVRQVYSATVKQDAVLGRILEVT